LFDNFPFFVSEISESSYYIHDVLLALKTPFVQKYVPIGGGNVINTIVLGQGPPLVLIHGFGGGVGTWVLTKFKFQYNLYIISSHIFQFLVSLLSSVEQKLWSCGDSTPFRSDQTVMKFSFI